jgi:predicted ferric reductase
MKLSVKAAFWILAYFLMAFGPLLIVLVSPRPAGREFWRELSVAVAFVGLALMGLQFIPTARLPFLADAFPMDAIYYFHHHSSQLALFLVLTHPIILFYNNPNTLRLLNVFTAPQRAVAGVVAVLAVLLLVLSSTQRRNLGLSYESWRVIHDILSFAAVGLALLHIFGVGYYSSGPVPYAMWSLLAILWAGLFVYVRFLKPVMMLSRPYELKQVTPERGDSWTLGIEPIGHPGLTFRPGQFAWLTIQASPFAIRQHPFSFSSSAERPGRLEFTVKELGDFTRVVKSIPPGQKVYLDGPYGTFSIDRHDAPGYVLLAGGIGITPLISMLRTMADRGDKRPVTLFYGNLNWDAITFREELDQLEQRANLRVVHVLERPSADWRGEKGFITADLLKRHLPKEAQSLQYLMCGPLPMIEAVERALQKVGIPLTRVHSERYEMA